MLVAMSAPLVHALLSLALGFSLAGMLASGYQMLADRPAGFGLLEQRRIGRALAAVPFLVFAAPFIIMRHTLRGDGGPGRIQFVMLATVVVGVWSMMSGTVVVVALEAAGLLT